MNKYNAHLYLPLVKALAEGKTIQLLSNITNEWMDREHGVTFDLKPERYRIKPEPIKQDFYYLIHKNAKPFGSVLYGFSDLETAEKELDLINPKRDIYMIMCAKAEQILL